MPFRSLDDLRYLIEDWLPRLAGAVLTRANAGPDDHVERQQHNLRVVPDELYVDRIVRAMAETEYRSDPDDIRAKTEARLSRFRLRH
ncbi:MAG TPA: hypothetical protein VGJ92_11635 [Methanocella sp.]|jgi:hypothetical protein